MGRLTRFMRHRIPAGIGYSEERRLIILNRTFLLAFIGLGIIYSSFAVAYGWLIYKDFNRYFPYGVTLFPLLGATFIDWLIYKYLNRQRHYRLGVSVHGAILVFIIGFVTVCYGGIFSFEYAAVTIAIATMILFWHDKPVLYGATCAVIIAIWLIRAQFFTMPPQFPLPDEVRTAFFYISSAVIPMIIISMAYFIVGESERLESAFVSERDRSDALLANILPNEIADELKAKGTSEPREFKNATVLFTDFVGFTHVAERLSPKELVQELDLAFTRFDEIIKRHGLERLKTIGDSYMAVSGVPSALKDHAARAADAALEILAYIREMQNTRKRSKKPVWQIRIGLASGHLVAGIVGQSKFAYDVWGDTVNIASRMESSGKIGRINVSETTYRLLRKHFVLEPRGYIAAKNKGKMRMYFLNGRD